MPADDSHIDSRVVAAVRSGDVAAIAALVEVQPELLQLRVAPHGSTLLHVAAQAGHASASAYGPSPEVDRRMIETLAARGAVDVFGALVLGDDETAARLLDENGRAPGLLHLLARRGDARAAGWLLERGADPNERWRHFDAEVTPLHLAAQHGHVDVVRLLLDAGADPSIRDSKHDGDAAGWAEHGRVPPPATWREVVDVLEAHA